MSWKPRKTRHTYADPRLPVLFAFSKAVCTVLGETRSFHRSDRRRYDHSKERQATVWVGIHVPTLCGWRSPIYVWLHVGGYVWVDDRWVGCFRHHPEGLALRVRDVVAQDINVHRCDGRCHVRHVGAEGAERAEFEVKFLCR